MDPYLSIPFVAKKLSVSRQTLWRWVKEGKINAIRLPSGRFRISSEDLKLFLKKHGIQDPDKKDHENRILIVDDDPKIQKLLKNIVVQRGYPVETAADGFEAGIKVMQFKPNVVVLDLMIPRIDGFEVCKQIKHNTDTAYIKIMILTGYPSKENKKKSLDAGADTFLAKPFHKDEFIKEIEALLES
jgi:excisionase family DNA binding protein